MHTLHVDRPVTQMFLEGHDGELEDVQADQGLNRHWVRPQKVKIVVEAPRVDRREREVQ